MARTTKNAKATPNFAPAEWELVDASIAVDWLATMDKNRPVNSMTVNTYEKEIREGRWERNGEAIKFDDEGHLIDGQHRLKALARTIDTKNTPDEIILEMLVVRGLPPDSQLTMDQGRRRDAGQQLELLGHSRTKYSPVTVGQVVEFVDDDEHRKELDMVVAYRQRFKGNPIRPAICAAMMLLFARKDADAADEFMDSFTSGANLAPGSPILALRQRFEKARYNREQLSDRDGMYYFIQAWNAWVKGRPLNKMQRPTGPWVARHFEIFP